MAGGLAARGGGRGVRSGDGSGGWGWVAGPRGVLVVSISIAFAIRGNYSYAVMVPLIAATLSLLFQFLFGSEDPDFTEPLSQDLLAELTAKVREAVPEASTDRIATDLRTTRSAEATIQNLRSNATKHRTRTDSAPGASGVEFHAKKDKMFEDYRNNYKKKHGDRLAKYNGKAPELDAALRAMRASSRPH